MHYYIHKLDVMMSDDYLYDLYLYDDDIIQYSMCI